MRRSFRTRQRSRTSHHRAPGAVVPPLQPLAGQRSKRANARRGRQSRSLRRSLVLAVAGATLSLLLLLSWKAWHSYQLAQSISFDLQTLETLVAQPTTLDGMTLDTIDLLLSRMATQSQALQHEAAPFLWVMGGLGWLPAYGADLAAVPPLLDTASSLAQALDNAAPLALTLLTAQQQIGGFDPSLIDQLVAARSRLVQAQRAVTQAQVTWQRIEGTQLSDWLQPRLQRIETLLPVLDTAINTALVASDTAVALQPLLREPALDGQAMSSMLTERLGTARPQLAAAQQQLTR
ncbi:MAG: hypothetical protein HC837_06000 [Chloroflexaceae bacterium]|nr:hypothetical protein [Chloroflexaceae bacterium]